MNAHHALRHIRMFDNRHQQISPHSVLFPSKLQPQERDKKPEECYPDHLESGEELRFKPRHIPRITS